MNDPELDRSRRFLTKSIKQVVWLFPLILGALFALARMFMWIADYKE